MLTALNKKVTPTTLFEDIQTFLARQGKKNSEDEPFKFPCQFLPFFTLGKGERSIHFLLFNSLVASGYCVIPEFPLDGRDSLDLLVLDERNEPMAAIELKHYSVHQTNGVGQLLHTEVLPEVDPPNKQKTRKPSLDADYDKRKFSAVEWASGSRYLIAAKNSDDMVIPLIQIGLLTAIYETGCVKRLKSHPVHFLKKYVHSGVNGAISVNLPMREHPGNSAFRAKSAMDDVLSWWKNKNYYSKAICGWGPLESFSLPTPPPHGLKNFFPVVGRVGYVCVMTK